MINAEYFNCSLRLWSTIVAYKAYMLPSYTFDLGPWLGALNRLHQGNLSIAVEVVGDANANWDIEGVLLLWRGDKLVRTSDGVPRIESSASFTAETVPASVCQGVDLKNPNNGTGACALTLDGYHMSGSGSVTLSDGSRLKSSVHYALHYYSDVISFNNSAQTSSYMQASSHSSYWSTDSISKNKKVKKSLTHDFTYNWQNSGEVLTGGFWINSFNFSGIDGARASSQNHFQRLEMVEGNPSNYTMPPYIVSQPTHSVLLHTVDSFDTLNPIVLQLATATWAANKFNSSKMIKCSAMNSWKCWPRSPLKQTSLAASTSVSPGLGSSQQQNSIFLGSTLIPKDYRSPRTLRD